MEPSLILMQKESKEVVNRLDLPLSSAEASVPTSLSQYLSLKEIVQDRVKPCPGVISIQHLTSLDNEGLQQDHQIRVQVELPLLYRLK